MKRLSLLLALIALFVVCNNIKAQTKDVDPHDIVSLEGYKIQEVFRFKVDGKDYNMIFVTTKNVSAAKQVKEVYFAPCDFDGYVQIDGTKRMQIPPSAVNLVYHDLGDDSKSFCAVSIMTYLPATKDKSYLRKRYEEIRLPDDIAQKIVDLKAGDTQWENKTSVGFVRTNSTTLFPPKEE